MSKEPTSQPADNILNPLLPGKELNELWVIDTLNNVSDVISFLGSAAGCLEEAQIHYHFNGSDLHGCSLIFSMLETTINQVTSSLAKERGIK